MFRIIFKYAALLSLLMGISYATVQAAEFCDDAYAVSATFANQARWEMCWEQRNREGIIFHHVFYTPRNGVRQMVLYQASLAQVHVPYDDNGARFHDITDYGFGSANMRYLRAEDCPNGQLLAETTKNILCKQILLRDNAFIHGSDAFQGEALNLFSVSTIGAYNYIPQWRFYDDGTIEPSVGATGALQRFGKPEQAAQGWSIDKDKIGLAHVHNFFWRLDFDLARTSDNDAVEEINYVAKDHKLTRSITRFTAEVARNVNPEQARFWRVVDTGVSNSKNLPIAYDILLPDSGQKDDGPASEAFTHYDLYVTKGKTCELFASHNPELNACAQDVTQFTNNEVIEGKDIVLWPSTSFYHMPRTEDAPHMDAHWSTIRLVPRDWHDQNPLSDTPETLPSLSSATAHPH